LESILSSDVTKSLGLTALGVAALVLALAPGSARAHALESSLEPLPGHGHTLVLHSQFSSGEPAAGAAVALVAPAQQPIPLGQTDRTGQLVFQRPASAVLAQAPDWEVRIDQGSGHRDYVELPAPAPAAPMSLTPSPVKPWFAWAGAGLMLVGAVALRPPRQDR